MERHRKVRRKHPAFDETTSGNKRKMKVKLVGISIGIVIVLIVECGIGFIETDYNIQCLRHGAQRGILLC